MIRSALNTTTGLRRAQPFVRRTPLRGRYRNPVTKDTRDLMWIRSGGRCEIGITTACRRRSRLLTAGWQYSHRIRRVEGFHGPDNGLVSCSECHEWLPAETHRRWAERCGWLLPFATPDPATVPVLLPDRRWVLLTPDGSYDVLGAGGGS